LIDFLSRLVAVRLFLRLKIWIREKNVFVFLTYKDSIKLKKKITGKSKVFIVGTGLIGLKVVESLFE
jgi:NAD(P)H-nitrite reductase large subunit